MQKVKVETNVKGVKPLSALRQQKVLTGQEAHIGDFQTGEAMQWNNAVDVTPFRGR